MAEVNTDIGEVLEALNGKVDLDLGNCPIVANTDANNFTATGKQNVVGWGMPDYSAGVSKTGTWTADYAGVYVVRFGSVEAGTAGHFTINGATFYSRTYNLEEQQTITAPVGKGDVVVLHSANKGAIFYPLKGAK